MLKNIEKQVFAEIARGDAILMAFRNTTIKTATTNYGQIRILKLGLHEAISSHVTRLQLDCPV